MTNYLQHVALRMEGNVPTEEAMILPGKMVSFPAHMNGDDEQIPIAPEYPVEADPVVHAHKHYHIAPESAKPIAPSAVLPTPTSSYIDTRLQHPIKASVTSKTEKKVMSVEEPSIEKISSPAKPGDPEVVIAKENIEPREMVTTILKTEQRKTSSEKEITIAREVRQPEHVHHTPMLPPEPLPPQKIPAANKLTIGKISVEIVRPSQPVVKTKERVVTRVVSAGAQESGGTNKLSFGLKQF